MTLPSEQKNNPLGYAPILPLICKFAIPSILSMLVTAAYNITDQIFIGQKIGLTGNAATNVVFPLTMLITALSLLTGIGTASNFNISLGAKKEQDAREFVGSGLLMMGIVGICLFLLVFFLETPILLLCGATETVLPAAKAYLSVIAFGIPLLLFTTAGSVVIRADGSPRYSMLCIVSGALLNVFLDWLFLFVFDWGMAGAALATVIGQVLSFLLCLRYFFHFRTFPIKQNMLRLRKARMLQIARLGSSNCFNQLVMMCAQITLNHVLTFYGTGTVYGSDIPLAVAGISAKLNSIMVAFVVGLAQGCQPILSFNMGAKQYSRVKMTYRKAVSLALCFSFTAFFLFQLFPSQIISIFGDGNALYFAFGEKYLKTYLFMVGLFGIQPLTINFFASVGEVKRGIFLSLSRQGFILIPLLLLLPRFLGLEGVLYAGPIADGLSFLLCIVFILRFFRVLECASSSELPKS